MNTLQNTLQNTINALTAENKTLTRKIETLNDRFNSVVVLSENDYWVGVEVSAKDCITLAIENLEVEDITHENIEDLISDWVLHETIDGGAWIIYNRYHTWILEHSENTDYAIDSGLVEGITNYYDLKQALAFWALYADVQEKIQDLLEDLDTEDLVKMSGVK